MSLRDLRKGGRFRNNNSLGSLKWFIEGISEFLHFDLPKAWKLLESFNRSVGNISETPNRRTKSFYVGFINFADARQGGSEDGCVILIDPFSDQSWWPVFELFIIRDVESGFIVIPSNDDSDVVDQTFFCQFSYWSLVLRNVAEDQ